MGWVGKIQRRVELFIQALRPRFFQILLAVPMQIKIGGIVLFLVLVPGLLTFLLVRETMVRSFQEVARRHGIIVAREIVNHGAEALAVQDVSALRFLLQDVVNHDPYVRYVYMVDTQGNRVVEVAVPNQSGGENLFGSESPREWILEVGTQVRLVEGENAGDIGRVYVGVDMGEMRRIVDTVTAQILTGVIGSVVIAVIGSSVLAWVLVRPLMQLRSALQRVAQGDYTLRIPKSAEDEIGALLEDFNTLVARLAESEAERRKRERIRQNLMQRILQAQEDERKRIARELHDEIGQVIAAAMVALHQMEQEAPNPELQAHWASLRSLVLETLERLRNLAFELRPAALDTLGLVPALRHYIEAMQRRFPFQITFEVTFPEETRLRPEIENAVYRIVQEALNNAARHAACQHVSILLQRLDVHLVLIVEDDGKGFDVDAVLRSHGKRPPLGLYGMMERAQVLGGWLTIESHPGQGTTLYVYLPWEEASTEGDR